MTDYTKTTNFLAKDSLPDSDTNKIIRGSEFDTEFNNLVTAVATKANTASPTLTGTPAAPTAAAATNSTQVATTAYVTTAVANAIPAGTIVLWSGATSAIPTGWLICDGTSSTPDLRNRFVVGAGSTYSVDATGGSADATLPSHTHTATVTDPGHNHTFTKPVNEDGGGSGESEVQNTTTGTTSTATTGITVANSTEGSSATNANLPPYYALAYIMKS
jgi:microcystin-dependent protein